MIKTIIMILSVIPLIVSIYLLHKCDVYQDKFQDDIYYKTAEQKRNKPESSKDKFYRLGAATLIILFILVLINVILLCRFLDFSLRGFWLLQSLTFLLTLQYIFLRIFRIHLDKVNKRLEIFENNFNYLTYYLIFFIVLLALVIYCNYAAMHNKVLPNGLVVLLSYVFIFYYSIACLIKYLFVLDILKFQVKNLVSDEIETPDYKSEAVKLKFYSDVSNYDLNKLRNYWKSEYKAIYNRKFALKVPKQFKFSNKRLKISAVATFVFVILFVASFFNEEGIHELQLFPNEKKPNSKQSAVSFETFKDTLKTKTDKHLFFISAEGGGLKANIWTMKLLREIQNQTNSRFLDQTVSLSGASGGMMGLSLYSVLEGEFASKNNGKIDYNELENVINQIADKDFASRDMALTLGVDFARKLVGLSSIGKYRDRSYYALRTYQNCVTNSDFKRLDTTAFKTYWKRKVYDAKNYFPALIVNTAKTNGKRGVFFSLNYPDTLTIFNNAERLSSIPDSSVAFYEAVSTTNRFPFLSPAAKIKGYGHFIDGGAIDNSGLLSSLDFYQRLIKDKLVTDSVEVVFVQIINSKSNYIKKVLADYNTKFKKPLVMDEKELDNLVADVKTGLNLDKMPNYLSDFLSDYKSIRKNFTFMQFYLPYFLTKEDIEEVLGGKLDCDSKKAISTYLDTVNKQTTNVLKDDERVWKTYEPTLARHLSRSTVTYYDNILQHDSIQNKIKRIKSLTTN